ncbi:MAG: nuclear transport factor 2 family protein [Gammaproteobacteria bacterium]
MYGSRLARRTYTYRLIIATAASFCAPVAQLQTLSRDDDTLRQMVSEIKSADAAFFQAFSGRDLWAMGRLWAKTDYVSAIHPARATPFLNWDAVRMSWKQTFAHNRNIKLHQRAGSLHIAGDIAWIIDSTRFEAIQTQTGQPILMNNILATKIFEKHGHKWLLVHYHAHLPKFATRSHAHGTVPVPAAVPKLPHDVKQADDSFSKAFIQRDIAAMSQVWEEADEVSAIHPDYPAPFLGWRNVRVSWQQTFDYSRDIRLDTRVWHYHSVGPVVWIIESAQFDAVQTQTHQPIRLQNVLTTKIFEKTPHRWTLVHFHAHRGPTVQ